MNIWKYIESQGRRHAKKIIQEDAVTGETMTFEQLSENVNRFGSAFKKITIRGGVAICSENNIQFCWILLGALHAGARCSLLAPAYAAGELRHFLRLTRPSIVLCSKSVSEKVYEDGDSFHDICSEHAFIEGIYAWGIEKDCGKYTPLSSLLDVSPATEESNDLDEEVRDMANREAIVLASSGTTGLPKGVIMTHGAIIAVLKMCGFVASEGSVGLGLMPLFHAYGLMLGLISLCQGSKFIVVPKFLGAKYFRDLVVKHQVNDLYLITSLLATIGKDPMFLKEDLTCVRNVWTGTCSISRRVQERAKEKLSNATLHHSFGMSETTFVTMISNGEKLESCGKLIPGIQCRIIDNTKICQANEIGELQFKGPTLMKGYLDNEEATKQAFVDGWLKSGDLGYFDEDGYFFVVGRTKEVIKYQGHQVSPLEIEEIISMLPEVFESAVVGLSSEDFGDLPAAGIVVKQGVALTEEDIKDHVARHVAPYKRLRGGVFFLDQLPKSATGKISRPATLKIITNLLNQRRKTFMEGCAPNKVTKDIFSDSAISSTIPPL